VSTTSKLIYAIAFQLGWFVCIFAGNWLSTAYVISFLTIHFGVLAQKNKHLYFYSRLRKEVLWIAIVMAGGFILETLSFSAGFLYSGTSSNFEHLIFPPLWLLNLWLIFAIALRTCLSFIFYKPKVTYLLTCACIPFNYYAGAKLNNHVTIGSPYTLNLALIALTWVALLWFLIHLKRRYFEDIFNAS
jgi:hypothetical protein